MPHLIVEASIGNVAAVTDFVNDQLESAGCPMKTQIQIDIAIDEIFSNIALYAYAPDTGDACVEIDIKDNTAFITFSDSGVPYNPLLHEDPDTTLSADEREIGGLGILLVKKSMDDIYYAYEDCKNKLTIVKKLG